MQRILVLSVLSILPLLMAAGDPEPLGLPPAAPSLFQRFNPGFKVLPPRLRVALSTGEEQVRIDATRGGVRLFNGSGEEEFWPGRAPGPVLVVREGQGLEPKASVSRVQVGAFSDQTAARDLAVRMRAEFGETSEAVWDPARAIWRVRMGRGTSPVDLLPLLGRLRQSGFPDAWVTTDRERAGTPGSLKLLDSRWEVTPAGPGPLVFVPRGDGLLTVDGKPFRGLIEVRVSTTGTVLVINEVNLEDYLRGVVPEELGPVAYPNLEALKAQAVAARTYALANLGQYASEGYDLCDTPRCQVYGGRSSEHPLSDRAVRDTAGEILTYQNVVIQSLFTSTCGGHTEDVEQVFTEMAAPYLRGVPCEWSKHKSRPPVTLLARPLDNPFMDRQIPGDPDLLALGTLMAQGLIPNEARDPSWREQPVQPVEAGTWFRELVRRAGLTAPPAFSGTPHRQDLQGWIGTFLEPGLLAKTGNGPVPLPDIPSRAEVLDWLVRAADKWQVFPPLQGFVMGRDSRGAIRIKLKGSRREVRAEPEKADLYASAGGEWRPVSKLELAAGDPVSLVADANKSVLLLGAGERVNNAADRYSSKFRWTMTKSQTDLQKSIDTIAPVGEIQGLHVLRRGISGRVAELEITGSQGRALMEGFRIRRALDLPETLFNLEVARGPNGSLAKATFTGRGWGHGVGLCQTGAFGMARQGAKYRDILLHYYAGVKLMRLPRPKS